MKRPLMLWCSSHSTLSREEIPLFLEAGFRVVPLLTDFWTLQYDETLDTKICSDWKQTVGLPPEIIEKLQSLSFCTDNGCLPFLQNEIDLLNKYIDVIYITVLPNLAIRLSKVFDGMVIFRPFGHAGLNTYSNIAEHYGTGLEKLNGKANFHWVPILTTLQEVESPAICINATHLGAFVTNERLGRECWDSSTSEPYVVETIPRINTQKYYLDIYKQYRKDHGHLPLKILGGNESRGGCLDDTTIVGYLDDMAYYSTAARARISIYHGRSRYHVHYHPIEFMALGVPVLFHKDSAFAFEAKHFGITEEELLNCGMYESSEQANKMAGDALKDPSVAMEWSQRQRIFMDHIFNRDAALTQARWLKTRAQQFEIQRVQKSKFLIKQRSLATRIGKELKRAWNRYVVRHS